jgi:hypothetical protein
MQISAVPHFTPQFSGMSRRSDRFARNDPSPDAALHQRHIEVICRDRVGRAGVNASLFLSFKNTTGANDQNNLG